MEPIFESLHRLAVVFLLWYIIRLLTEIKDKK